MLSRCSDYDSPPEEERRPSQAAGRSVEIVIGRSVGLSKDETLLYRNIGLLKYGSVYWPIEVQVLGEMSVCGNVDMSRCQCAEISVCLSVKTWRSKRFARGPPYP